MSIEGSSVASTPPVDPPRQRHPSLEEGPLPSLTMPSVGSRHDPWWDLEGAGARRTRIRKRIESLTAFVLAVAACGLAAAAWFRLIGPEILARLG